MMYRINTECIACGRRFRSCPIECIYPGDGKYEIDQENTSNVEPATLSARSAQLSQRSNYKA